MVVLETYLFTRRPGSRCRNDSFLLAQICFLFINTKSSFFFYDISRCNHTYYFFVIDLGGQSGVAVTRSHGNDQDVGSNPAAARNEKMDIGQTPAQKVPQ